ncbi:MAG: DUF444 family protein [Nanoarchaeota archaeon]|nr:DUF444 family protein [Nanoarchaeota archaeon]MBU4351857.1 DUF444 family protein [Nanoarchaeota archaeon]MBU4456730.1 DUF444 family protein [Nanoarchaeota archaeon]MCG2719860.1 DUF444 family protein [Nanoarchaeota archaeon]
MVSNVDKDLKRFLDIIKGKIRKDLGDLIINDELMGKKGKEIVRIPLPGIDIPRFIYGQQEDQEGLGQGEGKEGDPIAPGDQEGEADGQKAGEGAGQHNVEVEVTIEELAQIMQEELELPNIKPKGKKRIYKEFDKFASLRKVGPDALLRFQPSYLEALKRTIASGEYNEEDPEIILTKEDMRFRSWKTKEIPESDAVIFYIMDVSGSMSDEHKKIARKISFWTDVWLRSQYKGLESIYLMHDFDAYRVDRKTFFTSSTSGGTKIWSGYDLANRIINQEFNPSEWNIYIFQYSDGENWGDNGDEFNILEKEILPKINLMCYAQIDIPWWQTHPYYSRNPQQLSLDDYEVKGPYLEELESFAELSKYADKIVTSQLLGEEDIYPTIKDFLGTGK